ncbi:hypothetical protein SELMODRAFT_156443 [Selaginella moellendorffii]|uniref:Uncharacterized protein n=1 Tax=Selaginella moellendorffii TaxID=88036 RepID=D8SLL9_SELML|nr:tryptophan synthase alpha chain [Selaginella moellendorffii]EFJ14796.1 hypothetical protein SELMODRAFT_156443 [Selaginella moellendorffii]|eukprot:XP_002984286.1 tryptophan synthase alpha chain [Selaginella moellendorffii]
MAALQPVGMNSAPFIRSSSGRAQVFAVAAVGTPVVTGKGVSAKFAQLRELKKIALIPYITAGDPNLETTADALKLLDARGADIIELGVPYSDPLADGPVIQAAATKALRNGTTLENVLSMVHEVAPTLSAPLVLFTYFNPILKRGIDNFVASIKEAGVSGLVVPDVPLEETQALREKTAAQDIELVLLTTPTTPRERMEEIAKSSQGFVYLVSLTGVTGARASLSIRVEELLKDLKQVTTKPIAVGFGVSTPEQAAQIAKWGADGVIVGSAAVKLLGESSSPKEGLAKLGAFISEMRSVL